MINSNYKMTPKIQDDVNECNIDAPCDRCDAEIRLATNNAYEQGRASMLQDVLEKIDRVPIFARDVIFIHKLEEELKAMLTEKK